MIANSKNIGPDTFEYGDIVRHKRSGKEGFVTVVYSASRIGVRTQERVIIGDTVVGRDFELITDRNVVSVDELVEMHQAYC